MSATTYNMGKASCPNPSRASYIKGCRCLKCRAANADYAWALENGAKPRERSQRPHATRRQTSMARNRVRGWIAAGVPKRRICEELGMSRSSLNALLTGHHRTGEPVKRMDLANYEAIMAHGDTFGKPDGALMDGSGFWRAVRWFEEHGISRYRVAKEAGIPVATLYGKEGAQVTMGNARKLARVAARLKEEADA